MRRMKYFALLTIAVGVSFLAAPTARAQVSLNFGINVGPQPVCPYGYFDYAPYNCAPYGYYGPEWFSNGIFIGSGPWYQGPRRFHGYYDRRYDPRYGYRGRLPRRGERGDFRGYGHGHGDFHGRDMRDGRGDYGHGDHGDHGGGHGDHGDHGDHGHDHGH